MAGQPAQHDDVELAAVPHTLIATWPVGFFLENIAILPDVDLVISVHNRKELHRATSRGQHHRWVSMPAPPAGMVATETAVFVVAGEPGQGPHHLYEVTLVGEVVQRAAIPDTLFLNGFTPGPHGIGYAVDSIAGTVIAIDLDSGASQAVVADERLTKISDEPMLPGANGIKAGDRALYITNTDRALVLQAPLDDSGSPVGTIDTVAEHLRGDDLAVADNGDLFIANHIHNTVIRLKPDGKRVAVAGPDQGMAGSTACVFGTASDESESLFVTTTGGIVMPLNGVVQEAKLVRLDVGVTGRPLTFL
ncbi:SMP-30/gluconolactonase/LRE family protein [Mycobacterium sp. ML4]